MRLRSTSGTAAGARGPRRVVGSSLLVDASAQARARRALARSASRGRPTARPTRSGRRRLPSRGRSTGRAGRGRRRLPYVLLFPPFLAPCAPADSLPGRPAPPRVIQMAKAGFVFTPTAEAPDLATCVYCELGLDGWEPDDDPLSVPVLSLASLSPWSQALTRSPRRPNPQPRTPQADPQVPILHPLPILCALLVLQRRRRQQAVVHARFRLDEHHYRRRRDRAQSQAPGQVQARTDASSRARGRGRRGKGRRGGRGG